MLIPPNVASIDVDTSDGTVFTPFPFSFFRAEFDLKILVIFVCVIGL